VIFYFAGDADGSFRRAANTEAATYSSVQTIGVTTESDFVNSWNTVATTYQANGDNVSGVTYFGHGGNDDRTGEGELYFRSSLTANGTLDSGEISALTVLPYTSDATITLNSCNSGVGQASAAQNFANTQGVPTFGTNGYAYFSSVFGIYTPIDANTQRVFLEAYNRGQNSAFGDGTRRGMTEFNPFATSPGPSTSPTP
jgi:hypothetical protein